jgi:hypothetical protein
MGDGGTLGTTMRGALSSGGSPYGTASARRPEPGPGGVRSALEAGLAAAAGGPATAPCCGGDMGPALRGVREAGERAEGDSGTVWPISISEPARRLRDTARPSASGHLTSEHT